MTVQEKANQSRKIMREYRKGLLTEGEMLRSVIDLAYTPGGLLDVLCVIEEHEASVGMPETTEQYHESMALLTAPIE